MPEPIIFDQVQKDEYVDLVCRMYKVPTTYEETIESCVGQDFLNSAVKLVNHPLTNIHMHYAIFCRVAWAEAVLYDLGLADLDVKRKMLLRLRDSFREIQRLPKAWQDAFAPVWAHWLKVFEEEERHAAA